MCIPSICLSSFELLTVMLARFYFIFVCSLFFSAVSYHFIRLFSVSFSLHFPDSPSLGLFLTRPAMTLYVLRRGLFSSSLYISRRTAAPVIIVVCHPDRCYSHRKCLYPYHHLLPLIIFYSFLYTLFFQMSNSASSSASRRSRSVQNPHRSCYYPSWPNSSRRGNSGAALNSRAERRAAAVANASCAWREMPRGSPGTPADYLEALRRDQFSVHRHFDSRLRGSRGRVHQRRGSSSSHAAGNGSTPLRQSRTPSPPRRPSTVSALKFSFSVRYHPRLPLLLQMGRRDFVGLSSSSVDCLQNSPFSDVRYSLSSIPRNSSVEPLGDNADLARIVSVVLEQLLAASNVWSGIIGGCLDAFSSRQRVVNAIVESDSRVALSRVRDQGVVTDQCDIRVPFRSERSEVDDVCTFRCTNCSGIVCAPVYQCIRGHLVCWFCKPMESDCSICLLPFGHHRNLAIEEFIRARSFPCRYRSLGCDVTALSGSWNYHVQACSYAPAGARNRSSFEPVRLRLLSPAPVNSDSSLSDNDRGSQSAASSSSCRYRRKSFSPMLSVSSRGSAANSD